MGPKDPSLGRAYLDPKYILLWRHERLHFQNWDIQVGLSLAAVGGETLYQPPDLGVHLSNGELG